MLENRTEWSSGWVLAHGGYGREWQTPHPPSPTVNSRGPGVGGPAGMWGSWVVSAGVPCGRSVWWHDVCGRSDTSSDGVCASLFHMEKRDHRCGPCIPSLDHRVSRLIWFDVFAQRCYQKKKKKVRNKFLIIIRFFYMCLSELSFEFPRI